MSGLKLSSIASLSSAEQEDLNLPELSPEDLVALDKQVVSVQITVEEEKLGQMKPNMAAIAEYRWVGPSC